MTEWEKYVCLCMYVYHVCGKYVYVVIVCEYVLCGVCMCVQCGKCEGGVCVCVCELQGASSCKSNSKGHIM